MSKIKIDLSSWEIKKINRSKGRMKLMIKLSKDEAEGFKNWSSIIKPENINDEEFLKQIFFNGVEHLNQKLQAISRQILNDPDLRESLETSGFNVSALEKNLPQE